MTEDSEPTRSFEANRDRVHTLLITFVRSLRNEGVRCHSTAALDAARTLSLVDINDRSAVRTALSTAVLSRREDIDRFDRHFPTFWRQLHDIDDPVFEPLPEMGRRTPDADRLRSAPNGQTTENESTDADVSGLGDTSTMTGGSTVATVDTATGDGVPIYSPSGAGAAIDLSIDEESMADLEQAIKRLGRRLGTKTGRRYSDRESEVLDARRILRESISSGGTILSVPEQGRTRRALRAVVLVDVSRSVVETADRRLLLWACWLMSRHWRTVRVFFFDTSAREVTAAFDEPTIHAAVTALERAETEWGGGTRIGHSLASIRSASPMAVDRQTVTIVISDGLEVGEVDVLESELARLARKSSTVLWLNPLASSPEYRPTCRGMQAALPFIDGLFPIGSPEDLMSIVEDLDRVGLDGTAVPSAPG